MRKFWNFLYSFHDPVAIQSHFPRSFQAGEINIFRQKCKIAFPKKNRSLKLSKNILTSLKILYSLHDFLAIITLKTPIKGLFSFLRNIQWKCDHFIWQNLLSLFMLYSVLSCH